MLIDETVMGILFNKKQVQLLITPSVKRQYSITFQVCDLFLTKNENLTLNVGESKLVILKFS